MPKQEKTELKVVLEEEKEEQEASQSIITPIPTKTEAMCDTDMLGSMLSIYSPSGSEHPMIAYVTQYLRDAEMDYEIDTAGNIYFHNHVGGGSRILLNAHMDTVGSGAPDIFIEKQKKGTVLYSTNGQVIGGDDKCGVFAVLKLITNKAIDTPLSGLLCVAEETGCNGARHAMEHHFDKFDDVLFNITIDRRGNTDIITQNCDYQLCSKEMEDMLGKWGKEFGLKTESGSISDVSEIVSSLNINGINLFAGYYNAHSGSEYIIMEHLYESMGFIRHILPRLTVYFEANPDKIKYEPTKAISIWGGGAYGIGSYGGYETYGGIRYYNSGRTWSSADSDEDDDSESARDNGVQLFIDLLTEIEQKESNYFFMDELIEANIRLSKSGKSIVVPNAFTLYYVEIAVIEDYVPVSQNDMDAIISIKNLQAFVDEAAQKEYNDTDF